MRSVSLAAFLACSWFWCIGGFFPVILQQEFGQAAFAWFAVFNVVGATAFGFIWSEARRAAFLSRMQTPAQLFSAVVVVFQTWFVCWLSALTGALWPLGVFALAFTATAALRRREGALALVLVAATAAIFAFVAAQPAPAPVAAGPVQPFAHQILPLALGFFLAPCFDLTFHDAFRGSPRPRLTFALGLGILFPAFLAGMYVATPTLAALAGGTPELTAGLSAMAALLALQTGFTAALHAGRLHDAWRRREPWMPAAAGVAVTLAAVAVAPGAALIWPDALYALGLLVYKNFVFVIGGLFPLALLFAGARRAGLATALAVTPCYALGFLVGGVWAPLLSLAMVVIVAALAARRMQPLVPRDARS